MTLDGFETIAFRVRKHDYREFQRVSKQLYNAGKLKDPKVSIMAKMFLYVMTNQYLSFEAQAEAIISRESGVVMPSHT
jgi:hypothetical protein